jgi:chromosomal replication initiator protein
LPKEPLNAAVSAELDQIWTRVQGRLAAAVDESTYRIWLEPLTLREFTPERVTIGASAQSRSWIQERFGQLLQTCVTATLGNAVAVHVTGEPRGAESGSSAPATSDGEKARKASAPLGNPRYTFDQFVIGDSNRLAHAAALTVGELPGQAYNPLFICGPPGVGKTHLMHSIAGLLTDHNPGLVVRCATGESFTNDFRLALGDGQMDNFKSRFRHADVLLVDDVQFLERKAKTEEEFFHTFNALHETGAQIVLTSDRPPRDLQALEDRLRERFEAGLVADIQPPDYNTRLAILRKRVLQDNIELDDEQVLATIAERVVVNVRTLEGALIRTVAYGSLTGRRLSAQLAEEVLDGLYPRSERPCSVSEIQARACEHFGLTSDELLSSSRTARIAWPRQVAMYLARELTDDSLPAIGRNFGGRDHTTVLHAWRRTTARLAADANSRQAVDNLRRSLERGPS